MQANIREYRVEDKERVVALSLRAWAPVFASLEAILGAEIFTRLHGDWREYQARAVRDTLANAAVRTWVAEGARGVAGFVAANLHKEQAMGEVWMLAVDPDEQEHGIGLALTEFATAWLRQSGMKIAMIDSGGDPGHAPARHVYEKAGYTLLPVARYFKAI